MKTSRNPRTNGFTLIELMAVITIIVILAGLVVAGLGFVNERQAREKAKVQLKLLETALEEYKADHGTYPTTKNSKTGTQDVTDADGERSTLFQVLYKDGVDHDTKVYLKELDPDEGTMGWVQGSEIVDPWGVAFRYRTAIDDSGRTNTDTQNPDFDLWSSGKDQDSETSRANADYRRNADDIRNF